MITSKPSSRAYRDGFDRVFGERGPEDFIEEAEGVLAEKSAAYWRERAEKAEADLGIAQHAAKAEAQHANELQAELAEARRCLARVYCQYCGSPYGNTPSTGVCVFDEHHEAYAALGIAQHAAKAEAQHANELQAEPAKVKQIQYRACGPCQNEPCPHVVENEKLRADLAEAIKRIEDDNAVCICGCPSEDHESLREDGESCDNDDHQCLRVCGAAADMAVRLRMELAEARRCLSYADCSTCGGLYSENPNGICLRPEHIEAFDALGRPSARDGGALDGGTPVEVKP